MILAAMLLAQAAAPAAPPVPSDDVTVTARRIQRLREMRIVTKRDRRTGGTRCFLKPSSGDPALDAGVCDIYLGCRDRADTAAALDACMRPPLTDLVKRRLGPR